MTRSVRFGVLGVTHRGSGVTHRRFCQAQKHPFPPKSVSFTFRASVREIVGSEHLLISSGFGNIFSQKVPPAPCIAVFLGPCVGQGLLVESFHSGVGLARTGGRLRAAIPGPRLAGQKKAVPVLSLGLRALSPKRPSGSVPEGGRRRLHPGTGARHLEHFPVPPPGGAV